MTQYVWVSNVMRNTDKRWVDYNLFVEGKIDSQFLLQYSHILSEKECKKTEDIFKNNSTNYADLAQKYRFKKKLSPEYTPTRFYKISETPLVCDKSIFMGIGQFVFINEKSAKILKQYNLGNTDIIKLDPYDAVTGDHIESECSFYLLNIAETNEYCDLEKSENVYFFKPTKKMDGIPTESPEIIEDGFIINSNILESGLDLWADSRLKQSFFISDQLKKALDDAGISQDWLLTRCVVEG
ncbi:hypothetical protein OXI21_01185 [Ignatzschineria sp. RMDPL8A]|uniref:hypothetical protein n=1 Tax=Ignatzschineria sp. RMDPL8A TaxID=2999236 RepID=UPI0024466F53|nr:hypothetical protein [Ignatzschineria sp. RMDPL8A]MDG9729040.1 hypothetical protein [Ignatzschineria sp. RMDPL8A]